jgi:hypothetical protein
VGGASALPFHRIELMYMFMRCWYPECFAILLKTDKDKGSCECGLTKFRGVPLGSGKVTKLEEQLFKQGLVHLIDGDLVGLDPDTLNLDNDAYWKTVRENFGRQRTRARKRAAEKRRGELEKWLEEEAEREGFSFADIKARHEKESADRDSGLRRNDSGDK